MSKRELNNITEPVYELLKKETAARFEVDNVSELSDEQLDSLRCGDIVAKKTGNQKHAYIVSYKGEGAGEGICLTYCAAGYIETISYDYINGHWLFNSKDICEVASKDDVEDIIESGLVENAKPIYCHPITINYETSPKYIRITCLIFNNDPTPFTINSFKKWIDDVAEATENTARLMISGGVTYDTTSVIVSYLYKSASNNYIIGGLSRTTGENDYVSDADFNNLFPTGNLFIDGVNKIN